MISWYSIFAKRKERNMSHGGIYMHLSVVLIYFSVLNCNFRELHITGSKSEMLQLCSDVNEKIHKGMAKLSEKMYV
jgi:hypothetical protein